MEVSSGKSFEASADQERATSGM